MLPFNFLSNIIKNFTTGSKTALTNNGKLLSGGNDSNYRTWLKTNAVDPLKTSLDDLWANILSKPTKKNMNEVTRLQL